MRKKIIITVSVCVLLCLIFLIVRFAWDRTHNPVYIGERKSSEEVLTEFYEKVAEVPDYSPLDIETRIVGNHPDYNLNLEAQTYYSESAEDCLCVLAITGDTSSIKDINYIIVQTNECLGICGPSYGELWAETEDGNWVFVKELNPMTGSQAGNCINAYCSELESFKGNFMIVESCHAEVLDDLVEINRLYYIIHGAINSIV